MRRVFAGEEDGEKTRFRGSSSHSPAASPLTGHSGLSPGVCRVLTVLPCKVHTLEPAMGFGGRLFSEGEGPSERELPETVPPWRAAYSDSLP